MENYNQLISAIGSVLKSERFIKKGNSFYLSESGNNGIINFQKSRDSTKKEVIFTINVGVQSTTLSKVLKKNRHNDFPDMEDCHWKRRIGFLLPQKQDYWWRVTDDTNIEELIREISRVIKEVAIVYIKTNISDESLKLLWLDGRAMGITELQRYGYLTTLLKIYQDERLTAIIEEFISYAKGKSFEVTANEHIRNLK